MNYEKKVMVNAYEILTKKDFEWSYEFNHSMRVQFVNLLLEYFTEVEHYEKCAKLVTILKGLENMNENISETTTTGSDNN
jgi:hypothetical protein